MILRRLAVSLSLLGGSVLAVHSAPASAFLFGPSDTDTSICANIGNGFDTPAAYPSGWPQVDRLLMSIPPSLYKGNLEGGITNWHCRTDTGLTTGGQTCMGWNNQSLCAGGVWSMSFPVGTPVMIGKQDIQLNTNGGGYARSMSLVEWDFDGDGSYEVIDSGPWPTATGTSTCSGGGCQYSTRETRSTYFEGRTQFSSVGSHTVNMRVTYSDASTEVSSGTFTATTDTAIARITAPAIVLTDTTTTLDATASSAASGSLALFEWDLDGDGTYETNSGTTGTTTTAWTSRGVKTVGVRVTSRGGTVSTATTTIEVRQKPPVGDVGISINDGDAFTNSKAVRLHLIWPDNTVQVRVSNDGGFAASKTQTFDIDDIVTWNLDDTLTGIVSKVVYVRFLGSGVDGTKTFQDDIVLDTTAPIISSVSATRASGSASVSLQSLKAAAVDLRIGAKKSTTYRVSISARDRLSGVNKIQFNTKASAKGAKSAIYTRALKVRTSSRTLWVRVGDGAGNFTKWRQVRIPR